MTTFNFAGDIVLENERVLLTPLQLKHLDDLKIIIEKDTGLMTLSSIKVENAADLANYIDIALQAREERSRYQFVVFDKASARYAGSTSFCSVSNKDNRIEIGYTWIGYDFQRSGLNRAMKYLMLQYAFETLGSYRVEFTADSRNHQSRTAIAAIGATFEGELRSRILKPDGFRANTVYYGILADEWPKIKLDKFAGYL